MINKNKSTKIIYYQDELNDDFAGMSIKKKTVDNDFKYIHKNHIWKFFSFLTYYCIAMPYAFLYEKFFLRIKFVNKKAIKQLKKQKYYLYGNHTGMAIDAFTPNLISFPPRNKIIVSPETVSIPCLKNIVQMVGAIPTPSSFDGMRNFFNAVNYYHNSCNISIYPEAHIWPYYTGVRNFKDSSFAYPLKDNSPVVVFFTAYTEPKGLFKRFRKANITIYISDPIYPNPNIPKKQAQKELRDKVFNFMKDCSKNSTYNVITYKHISEKPKEEES